MASKKSNADIIRDAIKKFSSDKTPMSKRSLAKYLVNKYPSNFRSVETARKQVREITGSNGAASRKPGKLTPKLYTFNDLPESHSEPWVPYVINHKKFNRILILSDIHFPYHDKIALDAAIQFGIKNKANMVVLNGDTLDMYQLSVFNKRPDKADMAIEFKMAKDFIKLMRKTFKNIIWKNGNHDERYELFLMKNPAIFGVDDFQLEKILGLDKNEYITEKRVIKAGKLSILHGHEVGKGIFSPVNFARTLQLKTGESTIAGHVHYASQHPFKRLNGEQLMCYSQGCLCELQPQYMPINQWKHGFAFVEIETNGNFHVQNKEIINGKVY